MYYKKKSVKGWKGPGTVLGCDGKLVLVIHEGAFLRCHASNLIHKEKWNTKAGVRKKVELKRQVTFVDELDKKKKRLVKDSDEETSSDDDANVDGNNDEDEDNNNEGRG